MANDLDVAEQEDRLFPSVVPEQIDLRDIASSGFAVVSYLKILVVGPLGIGALAIVSATGTSWEQFPVTTQAAASYFDGVLVPEELLAGAASRGQGSGDETARRGEGLPALEIGPSEPQISDIQIDATVPKLQLETQPNPASEPAAPSAPTLVTVQ